MAKPVSPQEMFELWQKMFAPATIPMQNLMFPDLKDVDKKISELETVENWLKANLNMLQLSIKSLEYQRAMLKGGEKTKAALSEAASRDASPNPTQWAWDLMVPGTRTPAPAKKRRH